MAKKNRIVFFFPSYRSNEATPPVALISIAAPLLNAGYEVEIVDSTVEEDYLGEVMARMDGALCLGISLITGPMIEEAVEVGAAVKERYPDIPIVLGGWHPSILPEQSLEPSFVDVVVLRQGEITMLELADRFRDGASLEDVSGILWKDNGTLQRNAPRMYPKVAELPSRIPGYDLIDYDRYERHTGLRWLMYTTSHGCPYNCSYCSNASVYGRNLDLLPVDQVVDEITYLVRKFNVKLLGLTDDIFFAFRDRSLEIAEGIVRSGLKFEWYTQDRSDCWARMTHEQAKLFYRSGLRRVCFGAESGSDDVLLSIEKRSGVESTLMAAERCRDAGIRASFGFIFGLPAETEEDLQQTVDLIDQIYRVNPKADCNTNIFTPYPGSPLWPVALEKGFKAPQSFEEWAELYPRTIRLPWMSKEEHFRLQAIRQYLRFGYHQVKVGERPHSAGHQMLLNLFKSTSRFRIRKKMFSFPWEYHTYQVLQQLTHGVYADPRF